MPSVTLDAGDAAELTEMLAFIGQWLARDPGRLGASLEDFAATPATASSSGSAVHCGGRPGPRLRLHGRGPGAG